MSDQLTSLRAWVRKNLGDSPPAVKFTLHHTRARTKLGLGPLVSTFAVTSDADAVELGGIIYNEAESEANIYGGRQVYSVCSYVEGSSEPSGSKSIAILAPDPLESEEDGGSLPGGNYQPTAAGLVQQSMRQSDLSTRNMLAAVTSMAGMAQKMLEHQERRLNIMEKAHLDHLQAAGNYYEAQAELVANALKSASEEETKTAALNILQQAVGLAMPLGVDFIQKRLAASSESTEKKGKKDNGNPKESVVPGAPVVGEVGAKG